MTQDGVTWKAKKTLNDTMNAVQKTHEELATDVRGKIVVKLDVSVFTFRHFKEFSLRDINHRNV